jgi:hypothetical protein
MILTSYNDPHLLFVTLCHVDDRLPLPLRLKDGRTLATLSLSLELHSSDDA